MHKSESLIEKIKYAQKSAQKHLNLSNYQLTVLPPEIGQLTNLTSLNLFNNQLSTLPPEIGQLTNLTSLILSNNRLFVLPSEIGQLINLTELALFLNQLTTLPPEIGKLTRLKKFYCYCNRLTSLRLEVGNLTNLTSIDLSHNRLTTLPPEIGRLINLTELNLSDNPLITLPPEIGQLTKLECLDIDSFTIKSPPPEIISQGTNTIKEYLKSLLKEVDFGEKVYEAKLIIVGQGGVGKTCLCNRLRYNTYNNEEKPTEGISIRNWNLKAPDESGTPIKMNIWDFGGQEIYHATHQFFLTERSAYILAWDARQEDEYGRLDYWLSTIEAFAADSPIILVLNKCDDRIHDLNRKDLRERFPQIKGFYRVSCKIPEKGPDSFKELYNAISHAAWKLPLMGNKWIRSWLSLRKIIEVYPTNQISYDKYLDLCSNINIQQEHANILSKYLHDLGVILHFQKDDLLKHTIILKPEWVTRAVYKLLDTRAVKERQGILLENDLKNIWKEEDGYPSQTYPTLLRLLSNFELAFQMEDTHNYIIPELLPMEPRDFDWNYSNNVQFQYHYSFMPSGVMPRFIVRTHEDLERDRNGNYLCWKEGAILSREGSRAYIRAIPAERKIEIRINGDNNSELLAIIRRVFDHITKEVISKAT